MVLLEELRQTQQNVRKGMVEQALQREQTLRNIKT
jgi:hypothetical protein